VWSFGRSSSDSDTLDDPDALAERKSQDRLANSQLHHPMAQHDFVANLLLQYPDFVVQRYVQTKLYPMDAKLAYLLPGRHATSDATLFTISCGRCHTTITNG
jgi:hypothetical protein